MGANCLGRDSEDEDADSPPGSRSSSWEDMVSRINPQGCSYLSGVEMLGAGDQLDRNTTSCMSRAVNALYYPGSCGCLASFVSERAVKRSIAEAGGDELELRTSKPSRVGWEIRHERWIATTHIHKKRV